MLRLFFCLVVLCLAQPARAADAVDLKLVLALDASSSVDIGEYALQLRGIAAALRDPDVQGAISSGPHKRIAVNVVIWAEPRYEKLKTGWVTIATPEDAEAFAAKVENLPRRQFGGTGIGEGIAAALQSFDDTPLTSDRHVIDVSGDGRETLEFVPQLVILSHARKMAEQRGVIINGLAITNSDESLLQYFDEDVRTGENSFAISANDYFDFARAMRIKLLREIQPQWPVAEQDGQQRHLISRFATASP
jgi:hypothetical protein